MRDALRDVSKMDLDEFLYDSSARQARKVVQAGKVGVRFLNTLYQAEDAIWKIYAFENEKANYSKAHPEWSTTQVEEHAAKIVRDTYPTYSKIPEGIKAVRRFPLVGTFVSFPAEVIRTTFNTVKIGLEEMKSPETRAIGAQRMVGTAIALGGVSVLGRAVMAALGIGDDEDEDLRWFVAPWQENSRFLYTAKPEDATYQFVDLGYSDPHATLVDPLIALTRGDDWRASLMDATAEFLAPFTSEDILAKALMDLRSNEDHKIYNPRDTAGEQAKAIVGHLWSEALEPGTVSSGRRIHEAIQGTSPNRKVKTEVTALLTGQRHQTIDVEHSLGFRVRDFRKALAGIQSIARKTVTSRGKATGAMVATDVARMEKLRLAEFAEMQKIIGAARRLGVPTKNIEALLKDELPDEMADELLAGVYSPYELTPQTVRQMIQVSPEQFAERFAGWHGDKLPEAIIKHGTRVVVGIPGMPERKGKTAAKYKNAIAKRNEKLQTVKQDLDALGIPFDQAEQLLKDYYLERYKHLTPGFYTKRKALKKLYE